jgi:hypothetical protein
VIWSCSVNGTLHDVNLLSVSQRVLMDYNWQAIGLVAGHNWHDDFGRRSVHFADGSPERAAIIKGETGPIAQTDVPCSE